MKKIKLFVMLMGILTVFAFTGCASGTNGTDGSNGSNGSNGTNSSSGMNGSDNGNGVASDIGRMLDGENSYDNNAVGETPIRSGIHTNPEYSGVAYGGGYANIGK